MRRTCPWRAAGRRAPAQVDGGINRQMRRMLPPAEARMQACMRLSFDSRRGKFAGTITLPCLVVISMVPGSVALPMMPALCTDTISTFSTGAQSMPEQHSIGYQSWAAAAVAANSKPANIHALAIISLAGFAPLSSSSDSRPRLSTRGPPLRSHAPLRRAHSTQASSQRPRPTGTVCEGGPCAWSCKSIYCKCRAPRRRLRSKTV